MCGGGIPIVSDVVDVIGDAVEDVGGFVGDTVENLGNAAEAFVDDPFEFVGNVVENAMDDPLKAAATVAAAYFAPELLAEMGFADAAAASEFMAADASSLAAQGLSQEQIASTLAQSYGLDAAAASSIAAATEAGTAGGLDAVGAPVVDQSTNAVVDQWGNVVPDTNGGLVTSIYDDGSTLITDSATGQVVGGTDFGGTEFTVADGVGTYTGTGEGLGGTAETNFGGGLADTTDVQNLLDYNATNSGLDSLNPKKVIDTVKSLTGDSTTPSTTTAARTGTGTGGLTMSNPIANLTPGVVGGKQDVELVGLPHFGEGGSSSSESSSPYSFQDLFNTKSSYNVLSAPVAGSLKSHVLGKGSTAKLAGLPGYLIKAADGGSIQEHQPEFYSEGGLSAAHRYVKGNGDGTSDSVPAMLANGEFVIPADVVSGLGNGSNDAGAQILDEFMKVIRSHKQKHDSSHLPPDSKGPLAYLLQAKKKTGKK